MDYSKLNMSKTYENFQPNVIHLNIEEQTEI